MVTIDLSNVQGIIHRFYPCQLSRHLLIGFGSRDAGRAFVNEILPLVTPAETGRPPANNRLLNISFTFDGLSMLGVSPGVLQEFPEEFSEGPDAITMGDFGDSAPVNWWNGKILMSSIHAIVHLFCEDASSMDDLTRHVRDAIRATGGQELFPTQTGNAIEGCHLGDGRLHFGYRDGISQPSIAWSDTLKTADTVDFRHFLLGYSTSDISSSPKISTMNAESSNAVALVRDGSYAVFRWIYQDVARFNRFLASEAPKMTPALAIADAQELLAAKLVGRWRDGTPLVMSPDKPNPVLARRNDFSYQTADPDGKICPVSAHIRVTNPRDQPLDFSEFGFVPRVIRRGTPFGPELSGTTDDGQQRGLVGMFLCASIAAQFYKLMSWMKANSFSPVFSGHVREQDPFASRLVPNASSDFRIPTNKGEITVTLQDFTRTLGTAFCLVPGMEALRWLGKDGG